ncbi:3',5'-cyclic-nucleotide phosphodiesterase [hydrothermal vent metagenome]|uniref:3',5'-cyclic-nucleotide phosphodiesterase n=1 Tax=hydrothermal vent metagenome TaxID=652676 RepID=A0A3B0Y052_9ZZZZ
MTTDPVLRIAQITDTHLYADPDAQLLGLNTRHCLQQVVNLARGRNPDLIVASGDLSHDGSEQAYTLMQACFDPMRIPVHCLPGNHDEAAMLKTRMSGNGYHCHTGFQSNGWQLIFLDSTITGSEGGHLSDDELQGLENRLKQASDSPTLVWLHHQPINIGSCWLDTMAVDNPDDFFAIIDRHPQVRGIIWGHVHQVFEQRRNNVQLLSTPSSCIQFLPGSKDFAVEHIPPGYRWLELYADGHFNTGVERLPNIPGNIDQSTRGY